MFNNRTSLLRRTIASKGYLMRRMERESAETRYYLDLASKAANAPLKRAYTDAALTYLKRQEYYIHKIIDNEHRKSN